MTFLLNWKHSPPRMNELAPKTFMLIQTPELHRVGCFYTMNASFCDSNYIEAQAQHTTSQVRVNKEVHEQA